MTLDRLVPFLVCICSSNSPVCCSIHNLSCNSVASSGPSIVYTYVRMLNNWLVYGTCARVQSLSAHCWCCERSARLHYLGLVSKVVSEFLVPTAQCTLMWWQYWNGEISCEFRWHIARETLILNYISHCSVQWEIGTENSKRTVHLW